MRDRRRSLRGIRTATLACVVVTASPAADQVLSDWPQFRGVRRDGISHDARGLRKSWPPEGPRVIWRRALGAGFSGIAASGENLYTLYADDRHEYLAAYLAASGEERWKVRIGTRFNSDAGDGPRSTPTVDGDLVYALASYGSLHAVRRSSGEAVWSLSLTGDLGGRTPTFGYAASPVIDGDLLLIEVGAGEGKRHFALDKLTGKTRWSALNGPAGYSSMLPVTIHGKRQYIAAGPTEIVSLLPSGDVLWEHEWQRGTIAMPLFVPPDKVFVSTTGDGGSMLLRVRQRGGGAVTEEVWRNQTMKSHFNASVFYRDCIFGFDESRLKCLAADTGRPCWVKRGLGKGSLIAADGMLIALGDEGHLVLAEATPAAYREGGRSRVFDGQSWTSPTLAGGRLFLRDHRELVCLEVGGS